MTTYPRELRTRDVAECGLEIRADGDGARKFAGHAAVFNSRTAIGNPLRWGWYEEVAAGAFAKTLQEGDARFLIDHDSAKIVARVTAGDLRLSEDDHGLAVDADLDEELSYVPDLVRNLDKKRITGMSFGFQVLKDHWSTVSVETKDGESVDAELRVIEEVRLFEVSAVTFPAYEETDAGLRSVVEAIRSARTPDLTEKAGHEPGETTRDLEIVSAGDLLSRRARHLARRYVA